MRLLLAWNEVNPNTADSEYGQTPLLLAAEIGHKGIVRALLERNGMNSHKSNQCSQPASPSGFGYGRTDLGFFSYGGGLT